MKSDKMTMSHAVPQKEKLDVSETTTSQQQRSEDISEQSFMHKTSTSPRRVKNTKQERQKLMQELKECEYKVMNKIVKASENSKFKETLRNVFIL